MGEWIDVNEKLPYVNERVLVVCVNPQNHMQEHVSICTYYGATHWVIDHFVRKPLWSGHKRVTHWMPLPELPDTPKERGEGK